MPELAADAHVARDHLIETGRLPAAERIARQQRVISAAGKFVEIGRMPHPLEEARFG